jgi:hypothetical protein
MGIICANFVMCSLWVKEMLNNKTFKKYTKHWKLFFDISLQNNSLILKEFKKKTNGATIGKIVIKFGRNEMSGCFIRHCAHP